jgi:small subunit ribosomal protein S13
VARVAGVDIPNNRKGYISLTYVYGIGISRARDIFSEAGLDPERKIKDLTEEEIDRIRRVIDGGYEVEGNLRAQRRMDLKRIMDIRCYRGLRHRFGLPARGQRTRTNSRTRKGPKKTIAGKKKLVK